MTQINFSPDFIKDYKGTPEQLLEIKAKLENLIKSNNDFDNFNRFEFLTESLNPLYNKLDEARSELSIEKLSETQIIPLAWNENSQNLFADNFFNVNYF